MPAPRSGNQAHSSRLCSKLGLPSHSAPRLQPLNPKQKFDRNRNTRSLMLPPWDSTRARKSVLSLLPQTRKYPQGLHAIQPLTQLFASLQAAACFRPKIVAVRSGHGARIGDKFPCIDDFNDILLELLCLTIAGLLVSWLSLSL
jgi:hypothetical protein